MRLIGPSIIIHVYLNKNSWIVKFVDNSSKDALDGNAMGLAKKVNGLIGCLFVKKMIRSEFGWTDISSLLDLNFTAIVIDGFKVSTN